MKSQIELRTNKTINLILLKAQKEFSLNTIQVEKLEYSLRVITSELSKVFILFLVFGFWDFQLMLLFSILFLFVSRPFSGGFHFKTYEGCLAFSVLFFSAGIVLSINFPATLKFSRFWILIFLSVSTYIKPEHSKKRPDYSNKTMLKFKLRLISITLSTFIIIYINGDLRLLSLFIWINSLQMMQLFASKGMMLNEKRKKRA